MNRFLRSIAPLAACVATFTGLRLGLRHAPVVAAPAAAPAAVSPVPTPASAAPEAALDDVETLRTSPAALAAAWMRLPPDQRGPALAALTRRCLDCGAKAEFAAFVKRLPADGTVEGVIGDALVAAAAATGDWRAAFEFLVPLLPAASGHGLSNAAIRLCAKWAEKEPAAATAAVAAAGPLPRGMSGELLATTLSSWGGVDFPAARDWLLARTVGNASPGMLAALFRAKNRAPLAEMLDAVDSVCSGPLRDQVVSDLSSDWPLPVDGEAVPDAEKAAGINARLLSVPAERLPQSLVRGVGRFAGWKLKDPWAWVATLPPALREAAAEGVSSAKAGAEKQKPATTIAEAFGFDTDPALRPAVVRGAVNAALWTDAIQAREAIQVLPAGEDRDAAIDACIHPLNYSAARADHAWKLVKLVTSPTLRRQLARRVLLGTGWDLDARQRTQEELRRSGLSPEDQAAVRRTLAR